MYPYNTKSDTRLIVTTEQSDNSNTSCIACHEPIRPGASVCRYCGTFQKRGLWKRLSNILKWVGGVVTVISLVVGMVTLSGYYQDWRKRRDAVAELVDAADWLIKAEDYGQAWQMYEEALTLIPSSAKTLHGQFKLAKVWLRNFSSSKETADEVLNRITSILYRGLRKADADEVATILAHVCWTQVIRAGNRDDTVFRIFIMFYWNYRVIEKYHKETDTNTYHIHEVYYSDDGIIVSWTESAVGPIGETVGELREDIRFFTKAFQKPVLKEETENGIEGKTLN